MKKIISLFLVLGMLFIVACSEEQIIDEGGLDVRTGSLISINENKLTIVFGDIAEDFVYEGDKSKLEEGLEVTITFVNKNYNQNTILSLEILGETPIITNFNECAQQGGAIMESYPRQCIYNEMYFVEELSLEKKCVNLNGGKWIESVQECEDISQDICEDLGGDFNDCGSACRNNPEAEFCTLQCVQYCSFEVKEESKICTKEYMPVCGINGKTYSNKCMAGGVEIKHEGMCGLQFNEEEKKECELKGGEYNKFGRAQLYDCNLKTKDEGNLCKDSSECEGLCLESGFCSQNTINFGCHDILENGKKVTICID